MQHVGIMSTIVGQCARMCEGVEHVHHCHTLCQLIETPNLVSDVRQQLTQHSDVRREGGRKGGRKGGREGGRGKGRKGGRKRGEDKRLKEGGKEENKGKKRDRSED